MRDYKLITSRIEDCMRNSSSRLVSLASALVLAISASSGAAEGDERASAQLFQEPEQRKAIRVKEYGVDSYARQSFFSRKDKVLQTNSSALVLRDGQPSPKTEVFTIPLFEGEQVTFATEDVRSIANGSWVWTVRQVLPEDFEQQLGSVYDANEFGLSLPEFRRRVLTAIFYVDSWDVHSITGEVAHTGEAAGAGVGPTPRDKDKVNKYRTKAFYSVEGTFTDLKTGKVYTVAPFPELPKYSLLMELDPDKRFPIDANVQENAIEQERSEELRENYTRYVEQLTGVRGLEDGSARLAKEEP